MKKQFLALVTVFFTTLGSVNSQAQNHELDQDSKLSLPRQVVQKIALDTKKTVAVYSSDAASKIVSEKDAELVASQLKTEQQLVVKEPHELDKEGAKTSWCRYPRPYYGGNYYGAYGYNYPSFYGYNYSGYTYSYYPYYQYNYGGYSYVYYWYRW